MKKYLFLFIYFVFFGCQAGTKNLVPENYQ
jgi:hypothetical protein